MDERATRLLHLVCTLTRPALHPLQVPTLQAAQLLDIFGACTRPACCVPMQVPVLQAAQHG